jgi:hypothetical protein
MSNQLSDDWNWSLAIAFLSLRHTRGSVLWIRFLSYIFFFFRMGHKLEECVRCCVVLRFSCCLLRWRFCGFLWVCWLRFSLMCSAVFSLLRGGCHRSLGVIMVAQSRGVNPDCRAITCVLFRLAVFCFFFFFLGLCYFCVVGVSRLYTAPLYFFRFYLFGSDNIGWFKGKRKKL